MSEGVSSSLPELDSLRAALGVSTADGPLTHALTHSTFAYENGGDDNERLEFLGDAVLGQAVTLMLYRAFPDAPEGELAKRRALIVSTPTLASIAEGLQLGDYLRLGRGEERTEGRKKPSLLADALEAVIGAVFLDAGHDAAHHLVAKLIGPLIDDPSTFQEVADPKTSLQEWCAAHSLPPARYDVDGDGPDHQRTFTAKVFIDHAAWEGVVVGEGVGSSKKAAEIDAAHHALRRVQGERA